MEAAIGAASGLIGSVLNHLSNDFVQAYVASSQLGLNSEQIKDGLLLTQGMLHEAQRRGVSGNPGLEGLLQKLVIKADEAEDALDELHYSFIQDWLDGTHCAVPDLGDDLRGHARHSRNALHHVVGNCIACFSCSSSMQDDGDAKLQFNRVAMSNKIKSLMEEIQPLCDRVSELLSLNTHATVTPRQRVTGSTIVQDILYGREDLLNKTIDVLTSSTEHCQTHSVLPIVGPGGIGKTTFTQHLFNHKRIEEHFAVRVWVCVSTDFDVVKLSQQILSSIRRSSTSNQTNNLADLQQSITQELKSKSFLIVFDDIWECNSEGWESLLAPLRKGETKGNMVLVTTRFPSKADMVKTIDEIALQGLDFNDFFTFFKSVIFGGNKPEHDQVDFDDLAIGIAKKLKGSPLAGKTVGRLLRKEISRKHWMEVLENNKWQKHENGDGIMTSLRISYDYLPFHLKKCFPYFPLFPEDYKFKNLEITYFWIAIGIIEKDEDYMEQLVENGFLVKENEHWSNQQYYVLHDLLHKLSEDVSSQECLNINDSARFRADAVPKSIRHLSITMEDKYDRRFRGEMIKLLSKIDTAKLRSLMIFRDCGETIYEVVKDTFNNIEVYSGLRVLFAIVKSPNSFPCSFSKLIHLRYLKIETRDGEVTLPSTLSRLYHLKLLDLSCWYGSTELPNEINHLVNLHHFIHREEVLSNVPEVGKMKYLKQLREFHVKKESVGFELSELGKLTELGGELRICNLEKVTTKEEAMNANIVSKGDLKKLELIWSNEHYQGTSSASLNGTTGLHDVLEGLEPHHNLQSLVIKNQGGSAGPGWLCGDSRTVMLKYLHLEGVSWVTHPPFGQLENLTSLTMIRISGLNQIRSGFGGVTDKSFVQLKEIVLDTLPDLTEWVGVPNADCFSRLEKICCKLCPRLCALPFLHECSFVSCNYLSILEIESCPKLVLPPMPHTPTLTRVSVSNSPVGRMECIEHNLSLTSYSGALDCHNMANKVERLEFRAGSKIPWAELPKLTSLRKLMIVNEPSFVSVPLLSELTSLTSLSLVDCKNITLNGSNPLITAVNLEELTVYNNGYDGPRSVAADFLSELVVASRTKQFTAGCLELKSLLVDSISAVLAAPVCSLLATNLHSLNFLYDQRMESFTEEEENALQLLASLRTLSFGQCPNLPSLPQGLHRLSSLQLLILVKCSPELHEQSKKLRESKPELLIISRDANANFSPAPIRLTAEVESAHNLAQD